MCGIAFSYALSPSPPGSSAADKAAVARMMSHLRHRGPDGAGLVAHGRAVLGHTRLAIMDPVGGQQPLGDADSRRFAVSNGEIYNHAALRQAYGDVFRFRTRSDAEVLLPTLAELGWEGVRTLDGMFSFAWSNGFGLCAARDPLGIKPLYYGRRGGHLLFASEMGALSGEVDEVAEFPPGHCYTPDRGFFPYYHVPYRAGTLQHVGDARRLVRETLAAAVHSHLMSDVPVGAFLSGGLDSSLLALLARREVSELHTFAVGMSGSPDLAAAEEVAAAIGSRHHACVLTEAMVEEAVVPVVTALESYDAALVRSAIPTWFVARMAAQTRTANGQRIKVVLTGEGADELFAGYDYLHPFRGQRLEDELSRLLSSLHHLNLQRVDRMTMAHGLEARVPFLGTGVVERLMSIHPVLKETAAFGREKGLLRSAFEGDLPHDILWRRKAEFSQGTKVSACLGKLVARQVSAHEWAQAQANGLPVATPEEYFYFRILKTHLRAPLRAGTIGRWQGPVL